MSPAAVDEEELLEAVADTSRRMVLDLLLTQGRTTPTALAAELPFTRQAVAKHLATLGEAGLIERAPGGGREVHYRLRPRALHGAATWLSQADAAWEQRLSRLKQAVEGRVEP